MKSRMPAGPALALALAAAVCCAALPALAAAQTKPKYERSEVPYTLPQVTLVNQEGAPVPLALLERSDKPVLVNFIFATCTTICPVLSAGFASLQRKLGPEAAGAWMVSFSIDPEYDTPPIMKEYLKRYGARPGWDFLTGTRKDIDAVMHGFDAYVGNKMNHRPLTFLKAPGSAVWVRIDGLTGTSDLLKEYQQLPKR